MKIRVKTAGNLGKYLPAGSSGNLAEIDVAEGATPADVMTKLGLPEGSYLVILNGDSVPKAERGSRALAENDNLSIMPPLKGG